MEMKGERVLAGNDANILEREGRAGLKEEQLCDNIKQYRLRMKRELDVMSKLRTNCQIPDSPCFVDG